MAVGTERSLAYLRLSVASGIMYHTDQHLLQEGQGMCVCVGGYISTCLVRIGYVYVEGGRG